MFRRLLHKTYNVFSMLMQQRSMSSIMALIPYTSLILQPKWKRIATVLAGLNDLSSAWRLLRDRFVAIRRRLSGGVEGFGHYVDGRVQSRPLAQLLCGPVDDIHFPGIVRAPRDAASRSSRVSGGS